MEQVLSVSSGKVKHSVELAKSLKVEAVEKLKSSGNGIQEYKITISSPYYDALEAPDAKHLAIQAAEANGVQNAHGRRDGIPYDPATGQGKAAKVKLSEYNRAATDPGQAQTGDRIWHKLFWVA